MTTTETTEAECDALVAEFELAQRVFWTEGRWFTGNDLYRWRQLPAQEKAYFAALVAPCHDPHACTRTGETSTASDGSPRITYTPPYPEPCACTARVFVDGERSAVRCSRCLHVWSLRHQDEPSMLVMVSRGSLTHPLSASVDRKDMGYAIERLAAGATP
jgi:hypothetical protein